MLKCWLILSSSVSLCVFVFPSDCVCVRVCVMLFQLGGCVFNQLMVAVHPASGAVASVGHQWTQLHTDMLLSSTSLPLSHHLLDCSTDMYDTVPSLTPIFVGNHNSLHDLPTDREFEVECYEF